jgi:hypothetical protein
MNDRAVFYKDPNAERLIFKDAANEQVSHSETEAFVKFVVQDKYSKIPSGKFAYLPWIGKRFSSFKSRLFLVGESYYWDEHCGNENYKYDQYGQALIAERMLGEKNANYTKLFNAVSPYKIDSRETRIKLCSSFVYFNLIQRCLIGRTAKEGGDFVNGWGSFFKAAVMLKPTLCVFNGFSSRTYLERGIAEAEKELQISVDWATEEISRELKSINGCDVLSPVRLKINNVHSVLILWLKHSSIGFTPKEWHDKYLMQSEEFRKWVEESAR